LAWLGLIAVVGIAACCLDALLQALGRRRDRIRRAEGLPVRGRSRQVAARVAPFAAALVVLGGVLAVGRAGSGGSSSSSGSSRGPSTGTSRSGSSSSGATTTTVAGGERTPSQVRVAVLNASHVAKAASTEAITLRGAGYVIIGVGDAVLRAGRAVQCAPGFEREAVTLAKRSGGGFVVEPFPRTVPASATGADCLVVLGA